MGYDIELIPLKLPSETKFPVDAAAAARHVSASAVSLEPAATREILLGIAGCRPGPDDSVDYLGSGLSYARMRVKAKAIHVENNCGPKDVLKLREALEQKLGPVFILDLQSGQLHDAESYRQWWAKPL